MVRTRRLAAVLLAVASLVLGVPANAGIGQVIGVDEYAYDPATDTIAQPTLTYFLVFENHGATTHSAVSDGGMFDTEAIAPDGSVAGSSDVRISDADPTHGQIGITLVDPSHRGHRLGMALKIATHDLALATFPDLRTVDTCNAEVNDHMNAVNEALGYRSIETLLELQKKL